MKLQTVTEPDHRELPDHIELGVRIAGMKMLDAKIMQRIAEVNHWSVRLYPKMEATRRLAAEQYAYARFLMGIDDYWLSTERSISVRMDYLMTDARLHGVGTPTPAPGAPATVPPGTPTT